MDNNQAEALIRSMATGAQPEPVTQAPIVDAPPAAEPVLISQAPSAPAFGDADAEKFLSTRFGHEVKLTEIESWKNRRDFANPLSEKVDELIRQGKPLEEVRAFFEIQSVDPAAMADMDALRTQIRIQNPGLSPSMVDAYISKTIADPSSEDNQDLAMIRIRANEARNFIAQHKVSTDIKVQPQQVQAPVGDSPEQAAAMLVLQENWPRIMNIVKPDISTENISINLEGGVFNHKYDVPPETVDLALNEAVKMAIQNKMPFTQENVNQLKSMAKQIALAQHLPQILEQVTKDAFESGRAAAMQRVAGPKPAAPVLGSVTPPETQKKRQFVA